MLTLALYVILALAVGGVLFFVSVALFGGSTTAKVPLPPIGPAADGGGSGSGAAAEGVIEQDDDSERSDLVLVAPDSVPVELPAGRPMSASDVDSLRLPVALRGYRMAETDEALDRLAQELRQRDEELAKLRSQIEAKSERSEDEAKPIDLAKSERSEDGATGQAIEDERVE